MKLARFNGGHIGVVTDFLIVDVSTACGVDPEEFPPVGMVRVIANFEALRPKIEAAVKAGPSIPLNQVRLETPQPWPRNLFALPNNYADHTAEMRGRAYAVGSGASPDEAGFFMKAASSMAGPQDAIVLPDRPDRMFHHECELAIIVGKRAENVSAADAAEYIFGYSCLIDVTMRGKEERVMRKSFSSFTPVGPWITTADEVGETGGIELRLSVNGEQKQHAFARDMIVGIHQAIELISHVCPLEAGDVIASGTMAGVGPLVSGDEVTIEIDRVGAMTLPVRTVTGVPA